jgi:hypothetical protein
VQQAKSKKAKKLGYNKYTDCTSFQQKIETLIPRPTSMRALRRNAMEKNSGARRGRQAKASLVFEEEESYCGGREESVCIYRKREIKEGTNFTKIPRRRTHKEDCGPHPPPKGAANSPHKIN